MSSEVLVIESGVLFQHLVRAMFVQLGCLATCASTTAEALQRLEECEPSLIVLNVHLGDGSGIDAAKSIRSLPRFRRTPILAVGLSVTSAERQALAHLGYVSFVHMPIQVDLFYGVATSFIASGARRHGGVASSAHPAM